MKLWTATTDGHNMDLVTTLHLTKFDAYKRVVADLLDSGRVLSIPKEEASSEVVLRKLWEATFDGACIIKEHEV